MKPKRRRTKLSGFASFESPQLPLHLRSEKPLCRLPPRLCCLNCQNSQNPSSPRPPCPVGPAGPKNPRPWLQLCRHIPCRLSTTRPGKRRERPDHPSFHRCCSWKFPVCQLHLFGFQACIQVPTTPRFSRLPRTMPEQAGRDGHLKAEGSAVAPLSCPQARTITRFHKEKKMCPAAASRSSAEGAANKKKSQKC